MGIAAITRDAGMVVYIVGVYSEVGGSWSIGLIHADGGHGAIGLCHVSFNALVSARGLGLGFVASSESWILRYLLLQLRLSLRLWHVIRLPHLP